jgi:hypothetical protein
MAKNRVTMNSFEKECSRLPRKKWRQALLTYAMAVSLGSQDIAWAACSDGTTLPAGGYTIGIAPVQTAANWTPHVFTATAGSLFVPDSSVHENNDPNGSLTGGGHSWVFDQGSTLCKMTDQGPSGQPATSWLLPPATATQCVILPVIKNGVVTNLGDIPYQGDVITPTCDPTKLSTATAPNPANTYLNQLGCAISHGAATDAHSATSFLFVAGIKGGLFSITLDNVANPVLGGDAGKTVGPQNFYSAIPEGQQLTSAAVSPDGQFIIATSLKRSALGGVRLPLVWACHHPLGEPGSPLKPINRRFFVPPAATVKCMSVGSHGLMTDLATNFGPDNQPYFGGQRVVTSFDAVPGGAFKSAWPNCIWRNDPLNTSLVSAFVNSSANGCGTAQSNFGFTSALITQPVTLIRHGQYMYTGPVGGTVVQFKVTVDPFSHLSKYAFRTYVTGISIVTGMGVAEDLQSLMIYSDPTGIGLPAQGVVTKLPLCEDM